MGLADLIPWRRKRLPRTAATVLFRGGIPPGAHEFPGLAARGVALGALAAAPGAAWTAELRHERWGRARVTALRDAPALPEEMVALQNGLDEQERRDLAAGSGTLVVELLDAPEDLLAARKRLLLFGHALASEDGVGLVDLQSQQLWSRQALAEECAHEAPTDVAALFTLHAVADEPQEPAWLHTHGLGAIGACDLDVVGAHPEVRSGNGFDLLRALVYAVLEGHLRPAGGTFAAARPGGGLRLVAAADYDRACAAGDRRDQGPFDDEHLLRRGVLCAPAGWLGRWRAPRPAPLLRAPLPERLLIHFSDAASELMAERARGTWPVFTALLAEFASELELPCLAKLGIATDDGGREHIWFQVHAAAADGLEATCVNRPFRVAGLREGQRGRHPLSLLTEWRIMSPAGDISPFRLQPARLIRSHLPQLRAAKAAG